jgi:hypothetical protein
MLIWRRVRLLKDVINTDLINTLNEAAQSVLKLFG